VGWLKRNGCSLAEAANAVTARNGKPGARGDDVYSRTSRRNGAWMMTAVVVSPSETFKHQMPLRA